MSKGQRVDMSQTAQNSGGKDGLNGNQEPNEPNWNASPHMGLPVSLNQNYEGSYDFAVGIPCQRKLCWGNMEANGTGSGWENVCSLKDSYEEQPSATDETFTLMTCEPNGFIDTELEKQILDLGLDEGELNPLENNLEPFFDDFGADGLTRRDRYSDTSDEKGTMDCSGAMGGMDVDVFDGDACRSRFLKMKSRKLQKFDSPNVEDMASTVSADSISESSHLLQEHIVLLDLQEDLPSVSAEEDISQHSDVSSVSEQSLPSSPKRRVVPKFMDSKSQAARAKMIPRRRNSNDDNEWKYVNSPNSHDHEMKTVENIAGSPKVSVQCSLCEGFEMTKSFKPEDCDEQNGAQSHALSSINSCSFAQLSSMVSANTDSANEYTKEKLRQAELLEDIEEDLIDLSYYKPVVPLQPPILYSTYENDTTTSLGDLPIELVQKILSYFSPMDLCRCVAPVCKRWYQLAYDPILWRQLSFDHTVVSISSFTLCRVISCAPFLRYLNFHGRSDLTISEIATLSQYCSYLKILDMGFCESVNFKILEVLVLNCQSLEELNIEGCSQIDHKCVKLIVNFPKLRRLNLSHCTLLSDESIILISSSLMKLECLNIDGISWIYDESIRHLVHHQRASLRALELDGAELTNSSFEALAECANLAKLSVSFAELLTDTTLNHLLKLKGIEHLRLRKGSEFTPLGLRSVFEANILKNLRLLDLTECTFLDDAGVLALAQCCGKTLGYLSLGWCWNITDMGLISIVDHCATLSYLDLLGLDKITGVCLDRIIEDMPKLRFLDLQNCNRIVDDIIMDVVRQKPDLVVINYYGEQFCADRSSMYQKNNWRTWQY